MVESIRRDLGDAGRGWRPWADVARPAQLPPPGDWRIWLLLGGRGSGKTRSAAEWIISEIASGRARSVALVGRTAADVRDVMVEGPSGVATVAPGWLRPLYEPTKRRVSWPNGATITTFAGEEPDSLRGPQHDLAWVDELAAFEKPDEVWNNLMLGLRLGQARCVVSTTPRPIPIVIKLVGRDGQDVKMVRMSTYDNLANLSPSFAKDVIARYAGTHWGRQELEAELLLDAPGALWTRDTLERTRVPVAPAMVWTAVGVDPSMGAGDSEGAAECGIVVVGVDGQAVPHGYVLADLSLKASPAKWAAAVVAAARNWGAREIVAEANQGGELVRTVLNTASPAANVVMVRAHESKAARAERRDRGCGSPARIRVMNFVIARESKPSTVGTISASR